MKIIARVLPLSLLCLLLVCTGSSQPQQWANSGGGNQTCWRTFYEPLLPYGEWVWQDNQGWSWSPYNMPVGWRPYSEGRWAYTDAGWCWDDDRPWGWATYHYGRWSFDSGLGWTWCPGCDWAPAWVTWRTGDDYVGWCALPPACQWTAGFGFARRDYDWDDLCPASNWCFVPRDCFLHHDLDRDLCDEARNVTCFGHTRADFDYRLHDGHIENRLPGGHEWVEKDLGHRLEARKLVPVGDLGEWRGVANANSNELRVFRPEHNGTRGLRFNDFPVGATPDSVANRHEQENQMLNQRHQELQSQLLERHRTEMSHTLNEQAATRLSQEHTAENRALVQQQQREHQQMEYWHGMERFRSAAPSAQPQQHFNFAPRSGGGGGGMAAPSHGGGGGTAAPSRGGGGGGGGSHGGGGGGRR